MTSYPGRLARRMGSALLVGAVGLSVSMCGGQDQAPPDVVQGMTDAQRHAWRTGICNLLAEDPTALDELEKAMVKTAGFTVPEAATVLSWAVAEDCPQFNALVGGHYGFEEPA